MAITLKNACAIGGEKIESEVYVDIGLEIFALMPPWALLNGNRSCIHGHAPAAPTRYVHFCLPVQRQQHWDYVDPLHEPTIRPPDLDYALG